MKKIIFIMLLLSVAFQVHALTHVERRFVPVAVYHIDESHFTRPGGPTSSYVLIHKPACQQGGIPDIDPGTVIANLDSSHYIFGYLETAADPNFWKIRFWGYIQRTHMTIKTYCSYPIQCIKQ